MIEQEAKVTELQGEHALVVVSRQSACGSCAAKSGCGTSVVASLFPQRSQQLRVANTQGARPGDRVIIGLEESGLQRASLLLYGVPLLGLLVGAAVGQQWGGSELQSILGGLFGASVGLWFVRWQSSRNASLRPVMLRRLPPDGIALADLKLR